MSEMFERVVEARARRDQPGAAEQRFGVLVPFLGQQHLVRLLVDPVVAAALLVRLPRELRRDLVQPVVRLDVVLGLAGDDERRARLVDQDRVDLVDDRVDEPALHALGRREHHVVAQVVEAELVVRAVGDVGARRRPACPRAPSATGSRRRSCRGSGRCGPSSRRRAAAR